MSVSHQSRVVTTPLPVPEHFSHAQQSFSLKKRRLPFSSSSSSSSVSLSPPLLSHSLPPRPPSKGCPPLSRIFPQRSPSPWTPLSKSLSQSPPSTHYDPSKPISYFSQCFTNLGLLGRGSFGEVFKVFSLQDGKLYAVKRSVQRFRGHRDRQRSLKEAKNHERLGAHPHILGFQAAWEEGGRLYIQTELCCTTLTLHAESAGSNIDETAAWNYLCDLLSALQHLHSQGFVHLDVKPANIFVTRSGRLKLGDFGLMLELGCQNGDKKARDEAQEGDPRYMAPELLRGEYTTAADVFSLGVSVLELACNIEVPKGGDGWQQLRQGYLPSQFTNTLSVEMQSVLKLMLTPEPSVRATVPQLLAISEVRRQRIRRQASLLLTESLLFLFALCQSVFLLGRRFLSSLWFPVVRLWRPAVPHTPPRENWEKEFSSHTPSFTDTIMGTLEDEIVFLSAVDHSPTFSQRAQSRLSMASTSTPLPKVLTSHLTPVKALTDTNSNTHDWSVSLTPASYTHSPLITQTCSQSNSADTDSSQGSVTRSPALNRSRPEQCCRPVFEPKNLLSLFDETTLEGQF